MTMYVDTHFHLDLWVNPFDISLKIEKEKIYTIAVVNLPTLFDNTKKIIGTKKYIRPAIGLHPELVKDHYKELEKFLLKMEETKYIGEIGLDFSIRNIASKELQLKVFKTIIERCAEYKNKIITIHSRRAEKETIEIIGKNFPGKIILHWYSGSKREQEKAIENGYYFSINEAMLNSKKGHEIIKMIPEDKILTESDGPFINNRFVPSSPLSMCKLIRKLETLYQKEEGYYKKIVYTNFQKILK